MASKTIRTFLRTYLVKTGRQGTIDVLESEWKEESKKIKQGLSFTVLKAPKRKTTEDFGKVRKRKKAHGNKEGDKKVKIPSDFKKLAKTVGLPDAHLKFFYENREKFHWEIKEDRKIYCSKLGRNQGTCNFSTEISLNCLRNHMISEHGHEELTCQKQDCQYVASQSTMNRHLAQFHTKFLPKTNYTYECKFDSCSFTTNSKIGLSEHESVHENRLHRCEFCTYSTGYARNLHDHIQAHFRLRGFECDLCSSKKAFYTKRALDLHKKIHAKDFTCSNCYQSHTSLGYLNKHVKICETRLKRKEKPS